MLKYLQMNIAPELLPVVQITLPIIVAMFGSLWIGISIQNKRFDDINKRMDDLRGDMNRGFDRVTKRLDDIDTTLKVHGERIAKLEERIPPLVHR